MDHPNHYSPCFLVAKPGGTAKRSVVDYKKVNQKRKLHGGLLPLMENTVETSAIDTKLNGQAVRLLSD